ncbi:pentatricopeptide repeat-containing protein-like [Dorcoceras hygrometricum]|uniref:Pentatricopeptide repeat-containing protein-like n=1 Tax=Dorcoceras hygrometricum TaxID=472368 RepID=A0A2Z7BGW5_9LAMI|nr:pentatricopeptide repeat-containing protein-like [Dorcoceras hygrometricum]
MKRRRAKESADELALMTSSVTSSYSADGLREQSQDISSWTTRRKQQQHPVESLYEPAVAMNTVASFAHPVTSEAVDDLRRVIKDGCQLLSSIQMAKTTRSLQKKRTQVLFLSVLYKTHFKREEVVSNGKKSEQRLIYFKSAIEEVYDVGATTVLWQIYIDYIVHQQRENENKDEAIDRL